MADEFIEELNQLMDSNWEIPADDVHQFVIDYGLPDIFAMIRNEDELNLKAELAEKIKELANSERKNEIMKSWLASVSSKHHPKLIQKLKKLREQVCRLECENNELIAELCSRRAVSPPGESRQEEAIEVPAQVEDVVDFPPDLSVAREQKRKRKRAKNNRRRKRKRINEDPKLSNPIEYRKAHGGGGPKNDEFSDTD